MGKIFCLIGRSAVGKSSVEKELEKLGYKRIVSNTTRNMRIGEVNGIDYNFITEEQFEKLKDTNELIEHTIYNKWIYSISKENIKDIDKQDYIAVVEPTGFRQLIEKLGKENVIPILLTLPPYMRLNFAINREPNGNDDTFKEITRRFQSDFDTFKEIESRNIFKIENINIQESVNLIDTYIKSNNYLYYSIPEDLPWGTTVKIIKIRDTRKANHLVKQIGNTGIVVGQNNNFGEKKYKIMFENDRNSTSYFLWEEIEVIQY